MQLRFSICPGSDSFILQSINHKWRNWKCQLKNLNFDPSMSIEEQLIEVPDRVNGDQYKKMLDYWFTDKAQVQNYIFSYHILYFICFMLYFFLRILQQLSEKKKEARAKLEILHRMGKRSYAVVSEKMVMLNSNSIKLYYIYSST